MAQLPGSPALHELLTKGKLSRHPKGQIVQTSDEAALFYLIKTGFVKRYLITNEGNLGVQVIYGPGDVFSITAVFNLLFHYVINDGPETIFYETMSNAELYSINKPTLLKAIEDDPMIYRGLFRESGRRLDSTLHGLENINMKTSYHRLAHQLVYYANQFGYKDRGGIRIVPKLTHQDLANVLGLTRETVSNAMSELKKNGLVKPGRYIVIPNIDKLEQEAYK